MDTDARRKTAVPTRTWAVCAAASLTLAAAACGGPGTGEAPRAVPEPLAVETVVAATSEIAERLEAGGVVAAGATATVSSRVLASVTDVRVRAGDRVRAGQVLVTLDDRDLAAQVQQWSAAVSAADGALPAAQADLAAAVAEQKLAAAWYARIETLQKRNSATLQELEEADARRAGARARVDAAQARVEQMAASAVAARASADAASTTRSFTSILAPFDGLVAERFIDPGVVASPGMPLLRLESVGRAQVEARVDEARVPFVRPGDRVEVYVGSAPQGGSAAAGVEGTVTEVARAIDPGQRTFLVKVSLPPGVAARTGTFARIGFRGPSRQALLIPVGAVRRQGQVATTFVVADGVARLRLLQVADAGGQAFEVAAGLDAGETVVLNPPADLADGRRVTPRAGGRPGARP